MKRKHFLSCGFLILAMIIMARTAHAEDFTFNVPVELHKIPTGVSQFHVVAEVLDKNKIRIGYVIGPNIPIVNGEYVGTVTVKFNAIPTRDPATATSYYVFINLNNAGGCLNTMNLNGSYPYDPTKPFVCDVEGSIPLSLKSTPGKILTPSKSIIK